MAPFGIKISLDHKIAFFVKNSPSAGFQPNEKIRQNLTKITVDPR